MQHDISVGQWIKQRRKQLRLTQAELAYHVGCAEVTLRKIEAGTRRPSTQLIMRCADHLHLTPDERTLFLQCARERIPQSTPLSPDRDKAPLGYVPNPLTSLLGRASQVAAICNLIRSQTRWVTIVGPPGVGKTRTSLQVAQELLEEFAHDVWFVSLAHLVDPADLLPTLIQHFKLSAPSQDYQDALREFLTNRRLLLVLDNLEHLAMAVPLLYELLTLAPQLSILATSRSLLRLPGEQIVALDPLLTPSFQADQPLGMWAAVPAVALFVQRAQAVAPTFQLTPENVEDVIAICRYVEGLPLALELAAARCILFSPHSLALRLTQRVQRLVDQTPHRQDRHSSLDAALRWSYDLLDPMTQSLLRCVAIFVGGWTLEGADAVWSMPHDTIADVEDGLTILLANSLIVRDHTDPNEPRFTMLETIRYYALDMLQQDPDHGEVASSHAHFYLTLVEDAYPHLSGQHQEDWQHRLTVEYSNIRAAIQWCIDAGTSAVESPPGTCAQAWEQPLGMLAVRFVQALYAYWFMRGMLTEGRRWATQALGSVDGQVNTAVASAWKALGTFAWRQGDHHAARESYQISLSLYERLNDHIGIASIQNNLGILAWEGGDLAGAYSHYQASLRIAEQAATPNVALTANTLNNLGILCSDKAEYHEASQYYRACLRLQREVGNLAGEVSILNNLGLCELGQHHLDEAWELLSTSVDIARQRQYHSALSLGLHNLGTVAQAKGQLDLAHTLYTEAHTLAAHNNDQRTVGIVLGRLGWLAVLGADYAAAATLLAQSSAQLEQVGDIRFLALTSTFHGVMARLQGHSATAWTSLRTGLAGFYQVHDPRGCAGALEELAVLAMTQTLYDHARRWFGAVDTLSAQMGNPLPLLEHRCSASARQIAQTQAATTPTAPDETSTQAIIAAVLNDQSLENERMGRQVVTMPIL